MIELVTFTGVDETTPCDALVELAARYPFCEFAVLAGTGTGSQPRFPPVATIERWRKVAREQEVHSAIHLCGRYSRGICKDDASEAAGLAAGFGRVQINLPEEDRRRNVAKLVTFAKRIGAATILQHDDAWDSAPAGWKGRTEHLFDRSGGRGIRAIEHWPSPPRGTSRRVGYAGGISPATIEQALGFARHFAGSRLWLDMESGVRTNGRFDIAAVEAVCKSIKASGLAGAAPNEQGDVSERKNPNAQSTNPLCDTGLPDNDPPKW